MFIKSLHMCTNFTNCHRRLLAQEAFKSNLSFEVGDYSLSCGSIDKRRLTYRLGFCGHGSLECCGSPQCTQECGPSSLRESSSAAQQERIRDKREEKEKCIVRGQTS